MIQLERLARFLASVVSTMFAFMHGSFLMKQAPCMTALAGPNTSKYRCRRAALDPKATLAPRCLNGRNDAQCGQNKSGALVLRPQAYWPMKCSKPDSPTGASANHGISADCLDRLSATRRMNGTS